MTNPLPFPSPLFILIISTFCSPNLKITKYCLLLNSYNTPFQPFMTLTFELPTTNFNNAKENIEAMIWNISGHWLAQLTFELSTTTNFNYAKERGHRNPIRQHTIRKHWNLSTGRAKFEHAQVSLEHLNLFRWQILAGFDHIRGP